MNGILTYIYHENQPNVSKCINHDVDQPAERFYASREGAEHHQPIVWWSLKNLLGVVPLCNVSRWKALRIQIVGPRTDQRKPCALFAAAMATSRWINAALRKSCGGMNKRMCSPPLGYINLHCKYTIHWVSGYNISLLWPTVLRYLVTPTDISRC